MTRLKALRENRSGVSRDLAKITAPTLIVVGDEDAATPLRLGKGINDAIAGSRLVTVPAGHTSPVEQPHAVRPRSSSS